jgi:hypothetical protein
MLSYTYIISYSDRERKDYKADLNECKRIVDGLNPYNTKATVRDRDGKWVYGNEPDLMTVQTLF